MIQTSIDPITWTADLRSDLAASWMDEIIEELFSMFLPKIPFDSGNMHDAVSAALLASAPNTITLDAPGIFYAAYVNAMMYPRVKKIAADGNYYQWFDKVERYVDTQVQALRALGVDVDKVKSRW